MRTKTDAPPSAGMKKLEREAKEAAAARIRGERLIQTLIGAGFDAVPLSTNVRRDDDGGWTPYIEISEVAAEKLLLLLSTMGGVRDA